MLTRYVLPFVAMITLTFAIVQMTKAYQKPEEITPPVEPAKSPFVQQLAGAGIIEPETENIAIGSHVPGIVDKVFVRVGQKVKPGDSLFQLDDRQLQAELKVRQALLNSAQASLKKLKDSPRPDERPTFTSRIQTAKVQLEDQVLLYNRVKKIADSSVIPEEEMTRRRMAVEVAKAQMEQIEAEYKLWESGAWEPDLKIAEAAVLQAQAQVAQTQTEIARLTATAPTEVWRDEATNTNSTIPFNRDFVVLQVNVRPGEFIANFGAQSLIVLGNTDLLHVRVDIDENDISRFEPNLPGVAICRGNPNQKYALQFVRVDPYVIPKKSLTGASTERVDTRVLQVLYAIDAKSDKLYVGQQMDVYLNAAEGP